MESFTVEAKTENWDEVLSFLEAFLEKEECSMKAQTQISIALEEMFVNVAHYAYNDTDVPADERIARVDLEVLKDEAASGGRKVKITLTDGGIPYDPLAKEDPDVTLSAEDRQIGGLGIFMVKKSMDSVHYEYRDGKNIFTMEKAIA
ncbi:MAG: ATP-binding protein [Lachnospiraceae bacterium]|nr:ATP-binding protein [Lachnospiraceae bacterium]